MGIVRVIVGFFATAGLLLVYGFALPLAVMLVTLYVVRIWPLAGSGKQTGPERSRGTGTLEPKSREEET